MANDVVLKLRLEGDNVVVNGVNHVSKSIDHMGGSAKRAIADVAHLGGAFVVFQGLAGSLSGAARALDEFTTAASRISLVAVSANAAATAQSALFKIAQESRVEYAALAETYARLARSGNELGVSQSRMLGITKSISQAMTIGGGSAESMKAALMQLSQGFASGTLRGEELNSVMEQTPRLAQAIADGMGKSVGELKKLGEEGKLTAQEVMGALEKQAPAIAAEFAKMTPTISQAFTVLKDGASKAFYEFDKGAGISADLATAMTSMAQSMSNAGEAARDFGEKYGAAIKTVGEIAAILAAIAAVDKLSGALAALARFAANPIVIGVTLAVSGTKALDSLLHETETGLEFQLAAAEKRLSTSIANRDRLGYGYNDLPADSRGAMEAGLKADEKAVNSLREALRKLRNEVAAKQPQAKAAASADQSLLDWHAEQIAAEEAMTAKRKKAIATYTDSLKTEKQKQVEAEKDRFKALTAVIGTNGKEYETQLAAHQVKLAEINKKGAGSSAGKAAAEKAHKEYLSDLKNQADAESAVIKEQLKLYAEHDKSLSSYLSNEQKRSKSLAETTDKMGDELATLGMTTEELANYRAAKLDAAAAGEILAAQGLEEAAQNLDVLQYLPEVAQQYRELAAAKREAAGELSEQALTGVNVAAKKVTIDAAKDSAKAWEKFSDDIERSLTDALMRSFESGESFGDSFIKNLKNTFKTAALKLVIQTVVGGTGNIIGTLGNAAINGVLGTSGSNGGAGTNYLGLANNASSAYSLYGAATGYNSTVNTAASLVGAGSATGASAASLAYANGVGALGGDSLGALIAANGSWGGVAVGTEAAATTGWASMLGEAATGAWVLAIPAIAGAISAAGSRKAYEFDGVAIKGDYAGSNFTGSAATKWEADGGWWESGDKMKKWMPLTDNKDAIIEAFFGGGLSRNGMTGYVTPTYGERTRASDLANLGDLRDTPSIAGVDNSALVAAWDAEYALWQRAHPLSFSGGSSDGGEWTGGDRPEEVSGYMPSLQNGGFFGAVSKTPVLSTDPVMLAALDNAIDATFKATQTSFKALANQFDDTDLAGKINAFSTSINLDTKSGDIDKVLAALASDVNAKMAQAFLPSIETLRLPEEAWQAAFNRVMVEVAGTSRILDMMGVSIKETFGSDTNKAITAIDGLSKAFGGIDALSTSFSAYYANFYSQEEQRAQAMEDMGKSFEALNVTMPKTREEFRAMVDGLDLATTGGQATFKAMMDLQGGFANLVPAITDVSTAVTDAAEALAKDRAALIAARNEATEAASTSLSDMQAAFDDLQKSITQGTVNGNLGALAFSASEFDSISSFVSYIDEANVKLAEIAKSPFADELSNYTTQIKALAQSVQDQAADSLMASRLKSGDIEGAVLATLSKAPLDPATYMLSRQGDRPLRGDFNQRADFDAAFARWESKQFNAGAFNHQAELAQVKAMVEIGNYQSANALSLPNAGGGYSAQFASDEVKYSIRKEIADGYGISVQGALADALSSALDVAVKASIRTNYTSTGPGIASVNAAQYDYKAAIESKYLNGQLMIGQGAIAYADGLNAINSALIRGAINAIDYGKGLALLNDQFGGGEYNVNDARLAGGTSANRLASAGMASIQFYFNSLAENVAALGVAAKAASEPVALVGESIGRMNSASSVFGQSAAAVMTGYMGMMGGGNGVMADGTATSEQLSAALQMYAEGAAGKQQALTEGSSYRSATLISMASGIASAVMTTQAASEAAKRIAELDSFSGSSDTQIRDVSLLMDGLQAFDAVSLENTFNKLSNALASKKITEGQYADLFNQSIATFTDEINTLESTFGNLRDVVKSLADALLVGNMTTLNPTQKLAEAQRQYDENLVMARTGDAQAVSDMRGVADSLLNIGKLTVSDYVSYATIFGTVIADLRNLEALGAGAVASGTAPKLTIPAFASGGAYGGGLALVGEQGPEIVNFDTPGTVSTASQTGGAFAAVVAELKAVREELAQLRADNNMGNAAVVNASKRSAKVLEKFDADGMPAVAA